MDDYPCPDYWVNLATQTADNAAQVAGRLARKERPEDRRFYRVLSRYARVCAYFNFADLMFRVAEVDTSRRILAKLTWALENLLEPGAAGGAHPNDVRIDGLKGEAIRLASSIGGRIEALDELDKDSDNPESYGQASGSWSPL